MKVSYVALAVLVFIASASALPQPKSKEQKQQEESVLICSGCKTVIGSIENWVESNKTITEIEELLEQLCADLGSVLENVCDRVIEGSIEKIIDWINENESPEQICDQLGLCPTPVPKSPLLCKGCQTVIGAIEGWVLNNKTVTEIEEMLEQLCALLGDTFEPICDRIVVVSVEKIVAWIENNESPEQICTQLGVCPLPSKTMPSSDFFCDTCHVIVTVVEDWLESNKTVTEIEEMLDQLCALLGTVFEEICDTIVDVGIHKLIQWINVYENPTIVCQQLGLCPTTLMKPFHIRAF